MLPDWKSKLILKINTAKEIEELHIRLRLAKDAEFAIGMLASFRPDASLRQIANTCQANQLTDPYLENFHIGV